MYKKIYFLYFLLGSTQAFAYLDPGSGSALLYALVGFFISVSYFMQGVWIDFSLYLGRSGEGKGLLGIKANILFHSEGPQYDHLFLPVIRLFEGPEKIVYITQYPRNEEKFGALPPGVSHFVLDSGPKGFATLNLVQADIFVTTTPQLDVMMFRRSKKVRHYCHMLHAASDISTYRFFSFDQFDSILCAGEYMKDSFRQLERMRGTREKKLLTTGITYFDALAKERGKSSPEKAGKTILLAPSWGPNGLFSVYGPELLERLPAGFEIIIRPHPQLKISEPELYSEVIRLAKAMSYGIDENPSNKAALSSADLMITDFSGVGYDFALGYEKPVIVMDSSIDYSLFEGRFLNTAMWPEGMRSSVGMEVDRTNIDKLPSIIDEALVHGSVLSKSKRETYLANYGHACETCKKQLLEILEELK